MGLRPGAHLEYNKTLTVHPEKVHWSMTVFPTQ